MTIARSLLALLMLLILTACHADQARVRSSPLGTPPVEEKPSEPEPIRLTLVGTNDLHGWVAPRRARLPDGTEVEEGGLETFAGYLANLRAQNPEGTLLLDAGDLFQGTLMSNLTEGEVVIDVMNHLGYQATALGNHEFDFGPVGPASTATTPDEDPLGALKARIAQAEFPVLAVNVHEASTGQQPAWLNNDGTLLISVKGVKVGLVGLSTPATPQTTNALNVSSLRFGDLVPEARLAAQGLRERGADVLVALAHAGGRCAASKDTRDLSTCDPTQEIFEMLLGLPPRTFDAVLAGHTHAPLAHFVNETPVIETSGLGREFAMIDLFIDPTRKRVLEDRTVIHGPTPICLRVDATAGGCDVRRFKDPSSVKLVPATFLGQPVQRDEKVAEMIAPALARVEAKQNQKLGVFVPVRLGRNYEAESALGDVLADSLREMEKADVALFNSGGLRADLPQGELRYGDVFEALPFDNFIATLTVNGEELQRLLQVAYGRKGVFQQSGLKLVLSRCPGPDRLQSIQLAGGKPPAPARLYKVVLPDFLARGGEGLGAVVASLPPGRVDFGMNRPLPLRDALIAHWQTPRKRELVAPRPGRLVFLDGGTSCHPGQQ